MAPGLLLITYTIPAENLVLGRRRSTLALRSDVNILGMLLAVMVFAAATLAASHFEDDLMDIVLSPKSTCTRGGHTEVSMTALLCGSGKSRDRDEANEKSNAGARPLS
ncbi:hypothetical protein PG994_004798 [Apiospora phragmitis]|uniref:Uncharacterized protein n=1 Tax=Apiospora phragmitis TaxID=2905665 RepID=A0ABR1VRM0_9PEZI